MDLFGFFRRSRKSPLSITPAEARAAAAAEAQPLHLPTVAPSPASPVTPEEVRRLLFDAVASGDETRLEALCREHQALILDHVPGWRDVPPEIRSRPELYQWYDNGLRAITRFCAEKLRRVDEIDRPRPAGV
jgi:hypothetical protein